MVWVLFDYGQVISHAQPADAMAGMARAAAADPEAFEAAYWRHRDAYDGAEHTQHSYWSAVADSRGTPVDEALAAALDALDVDSWLHPSDETLAVIRDLQVAGASLALLSNAPELHAQRIAAQEWMRPFGEHLYFSAHLRVIKPSPDIYARVLELLGAQPGDVIFVDDKAVNIAAAAALGIRTIHFTSPAQLRRELVAAGAL
jgi:putative hydrolase of the HAD superfamily